MACGRGSHALMAFGLWVAIHSNMVLADVGASDQSCVGGCFAAGLSGYAHFEQLMGPYFCLRQEIKSSNVVIRLKGTLLLTTSRCFRL